MKLKSLFASVLAFAAIAIACEPLEGELKEASLKIEGETSFTVDSKSQTVEVSILSTRDWTATSSESWLVVEPASGSASDKAQTVELTVLENTSYDRTATVTFSIGTITTKVTVNQTGNASAPDGTKENPFDVVTAVATCVETGETVTSQKYYTKGIVSAIKDASGIAQYGNVSFFITDDGTVSETTLLVFQALYLGGEKFTSEGQIKVGDEVTVYGALVNFKGKTPETDGKGSTSIVVLNGEEKYVEEGGNVGEITTEPKGTGTADDPFNAAAAIQKCVEIGTTASTETYFVKGIVASIKELDTATYGNATFYISDDGTATDQFYIYRCKYIGGEKFTSADQLKVGQEVVVKGSLINYYGDTPEMTQGCELVSVEGEGSGSEPDPIEEPTEFTEVTIAQFLAAAEDDTWYKVTGQVTNIENEQYGNLTLKDETDEVYIYGVSSKFASSNDQLFSTLGITLGDNLTIAVQRGSYNNNPQGVNGFYISHTEGELDLGPASDFTKVSGEVSDWTGTYLIMMADGKAHATVNGKDLAATSDVLTVTDGVINTFDAYAVTIAQEGEGWSIKLPNGKYLSLAHNSAASSDSPVVFSIENTDAGVKIFAVPSGKDVNYYLYQNVNASDGKIYYRFYVDKSTEKNFTLPTLYKK